ncbi:hypothetical protein KA005_39395, partial [bacterium]|nr:hypothetical protein [bacterium]
TERLYIEPFLEALGWNIRSRQVRKNRSVLLGNKRTDYSFWQERNPLFILEAKAASVSLDGYYTVKGERVSFPEKTIEYAWNTNVPVGVLFNFKELRIYNATVKVDDHNRSLLAAPIRYTEMLHRLEDLKLISKDSVFSGALIDKVRTQNIREVLPIRQTIDKAILQYILKWRKELFTHLLAKYKTLPDKSYEYRQTVQLFLDRIIFIRVVEDLNIEKMDGLWSIVTGTDKPYMEKLVKYFEYMDRFYNSMLFAKAFLDHIEIDDEILSSIIKDAYSFKFDKLPIDLFGSFYENYLGQIIEEGEIVDAKQQIKAKGIFYTHPKIVDLINTLTLKSKLDGIELKATDISELKLPIVSVLDPACGSG